MVACAVQDAKEKHTVFRRAVVDDIITVRMLANLSVPTTDDSRAHQRLRRKEREDGFDVVQPTIRSGRIVAGDIRSNPVDIALDLRWAENRGHPAHFCPCFSAATF